MFFFYLIEVDDVLNPILIVLLKQCLVLLRRVVDYLEPDFQGLLLD